MFWKCSNCGREISFEEHQQFTLSRVRKNRNFVPADDAGEMS